MKRIFDPVIRGFIDSLTLAVALVEAVVGGCIRVFGRILGAFVDHKPLQVAPGKERHLA